jgi:formate hydrogenlyase subunit 3/multisubunit Na+/H+ antiporter MnhD subunit
LNILLIPVVVPLVAGFILLFMPRQLRWLIPALALVVCLFSFAVGVSIFTFGRLEYKFAILTVGGFNFDLLLAATPLASFMFMFAAGFGVLITLYSLSSMQEANRLGEYYGSLLLTVGGSAGILFANHLLVLLVFWEIVTASLYLLITTGGRNSNFAATKSFAMIGASDAAFLLGIAMLWRQAGTLVISDISVPTVGAAAVGAFLLLLVAAVTKAGALPFHTWLPDSGEFTHASVMAILPAAIDKLLGIYLLVLIVRELFILKSPALSAALALIGAATIIVAVMIAMVQHNLKRLLSYHAISQVGYMILGIATMTPVGIAGGIFHMLNNAIYKCCLFLCGGAVEHATGTAELDRLGGLGRKMPVTFLACLTAALSISGIPPLNGFVSKWMVYQGVIQMGTANTAGAASGLWPVWLVAAMFGSALTLASFVKLIHSIFLSRLPLALRAVREAPPAMTVPMVVLAVLCIIFGVFYFVPLTLFIYPALGLSDATVTLGTWDSVGATALLLVGVIVALIILMVGFTASKARAVPTWAGGELQANDEIIVSGTHFYKTVSEMPGLKPLYAGQEKRLFDLYDQTGRLGSAVSALLRYLHCGVLPVYLTWVSVGLLIILFVVCKIW